jgi:hypothetical protein
MTQIKVARNAPDRFKKLLSFFPERIRIFLVSFEIGYINLLMNIEHGYLTFGGTLDKQSLFEILHSVLICGACSIVFTKV